MKFYVLFLLESLNLRVHDGVRVGWLGRRRNEISVNVEPFTLTCVSAKFEFILLFTVES